VGTADLYRWAGSRRGARIGRMQLICVLATSRTGNCAGSFVLPGGTIRTQGYVDFDDRVDEVAVIGGTGAFVGAQGTLISEQLGGPASGRAVGTIRLVR
jgi:dirigent-like protein